MRKCSVEEALSRASMLAAFLPRAPDYWIPLLDTGAVKYVLTSDGVKAFTQHREPGLPFLSLEELPVRVLPRKVLDRLCSSEIVEEVLEALQRFYRDNYEYMERSVAREVVSKLETLRRLVEDT